MTLNSYRIGIGIKMAAVVAKSTNNRIPMKETCRIRPLANFPHLDAKANTASLQESTKTTLRSQSALRYTLETNMGRMRLRYLPY
jgi:hypothetical protein